jgi:hypothetical protein
MKKTWLCGVATAMAVALAAPVAAQQDGVQGQWSMTVSGGALVPAGGEFHQGGQGLVLGLPTSVQSRGTADIYDTGYGWRGGLGYGVSRSVELFGEFTWGRAGASELSVGNVAGLDLLAQFEDYTSYGMEGGMRLHFAPGSNVQPYMTAVAGFKRISRIPGTFSVPAAGVTLSDTPFYDSSVVPVVGAGFGLLFDVSPRVALGVDGGIRYHTKLAELDGLAGTGLENLNDAGSRWSVPISAVMRVRF